MADALSLEEASVLLTDIFEVDRAVLARHRDRWSEFYADRAWQTEKNHLAADEETRREWEEYAARNYPRFFRKLSRVASPGARSDFLRDRALLHEIADITKANGVCVVSGTTPRPVSVKGSRQRPRRRFTKEGSLFRSFRLRMTKLGKDNVKFVVWYDGRMHYEVRLPNYSHSSPLTRALAYGACIKYEHRWAFTLHLSDKVIDEALRSKRGFASYIQDRVRDSLKEALRGTRLRMPEFFLIPEIDPERTERIHVHGVIEIVNDPFSRFPGRATLNRRAISDALGQAGGISDFAPGERARVVDIRPCTGVAGWVSYITKWYLSVAANLDVMRRARGYAIPDRKETLVAATQGLRRAGGKWHRDALKSGNAFFEDTTAPGRARLKYLKRMRARTAGASARPLGPSFRLHHSPSAPSAARRESPKPPCPPTASATQPTENSGSLLGKYLEAASPWVHHRDGSHISGPP